LKIIAFKEILTFNGISKVFKVRLINTSFVYVWMYTIATK